MDQELYKKLESLFTEGQTVNSENMLTISTANKGATEKELEILSESDLKRIPKEYILFLRAFNGCKIFEFEGIAGFHFFSTSELINENKLLKETYDDLWDEDVVVFCSVLGSGDFIGFKLISGKYEILDCCHDDTPENWVVISNSFEFFLYQIIQATGDSYWLT